MPPIADPDPRRADGAPAPSWDVLCVGLSTWDTIVPVDGWPDPDGRRVVDRFVRAPGGPAATAAVAAASLGARTAFVGAVGDDEAGERISAAFRRAGVTAELLIVRDMPSAESVILVDGRAGTRSILHAPGAAVERLDAASLVRTAAWVHVDAAGYPIFRRAVEPDRLSVDAGNPIDGLEVAGIGCYAPTVAALLEQYPDRSVEAAVRDALDDGARRVAVTLGRDGAIAADGTGAWRVGPVAVDVRSTLGAGDVFHGALVAALALGAALPAALGRANLCAALSCRTLDGRSAIPTPDELAAMPEPAVEPIVLPGRT
jgi:sulfofructose kinase